MPHARFLPTHLRPRRAKVFTDGRTRPIDRNAKVRVMTRAHALSRRTEAGRHYGAVTAKAVAVLRALLYGFHNNADGRCFPSYERIAALADCARSTVAEAIKTLEAAGLLSWVNRIVRTRVHELDLFGKLAWRWRVIRTSNAYSFHDPGAPADRPNSSKSESRSGTQTPESSLLGSTAQARPIDPQDPLEQALAKLAALIRQKDSGALPEGRATMA